ncbi:MAG TPA: hypothetical protein VLU96_11850 [Gaiellaceae bacterium]|nr:hypothetical protein [Gaiellaceae bacterium]
MGDRQGAAALRRRVQPDDPEPARARLVGLSAGGYGTVFLALDAVTWLRLALTHLTPAR